jgi:Holliday junction resolvase RusA-like endonuclease
MQTQTKRQRQRENRKQKRQLAAQLRQQAQHNPGSVPIGIDIELAVSFEKYTISETRRELRNSEIDSTRVGLIMEIIGNKNLLKQRH